MLGFFEVMVSTSVEMCDAWRDVGYALCQLYTEGHGRVLHPLCSVEARYVTRRLCAFCVSSRVAARVKNSLAGSLFKVTRL